MHINAGLLFDLPHLDQSGADGIGLFRTELQFMIAATFPRLEQQTRLYKAILDAADQRPSCFVRSMSAATRCCPISAGAKEENPGIGWRAIRMALDRPAVFRTQVRALLRAAAWPRASPHAAHDRRYRGVRGGPRADRPRLTILKRHGRPEPKKLKVGAMIEVPAFLWQLDRVLPWPISPRWAQTI